jgi:diguanylate cyclase (GGDEF)-like protein
MPRAKGQGRKPKAPATPKVAAGPQAEPKPPRKRAPRRRDAAPVEHVEAPRPARAESMQLAAEVARLEFELAVARAQMVDLAARAETDPLTDLPNRRYFERELKRSLAYVKRYGTSAALIYIDLDGFKHINDRHGHAAGDTVLKAVAMVLARHARESDLVARIGGDEFVMLLWNCTEQDAQFKAEALEGAIARTTATHAGATLAVGASCGATSLLPLDRPADLLERADRAMYKRKTARSGLRAAAGA